MAILVVVCGKICGKMSRSGCWGFAASRVGLGPDILDMGQGEGRGKRNDSIGTKLLSLFHHKVVHHVKQQSVRIKCVVKCVVKSQKKSKKNKTKKSIKQSKKKVKKVREKNRRRKKFKKSKKKKSKKK